MTLRLATSHDIDALADLGRRAFVAKFGHLYSAANLAAFLAGLEDPVGVAVAAEVDLRGVIRGAVVDGMEGST